MSSSSGKFHRKSYYGSPHYQRKGILGKLFNLLTSDRHSRGHFEERYYDPHNKMNEPGRFSNCPKCKAQVPAGAKFCNECGEKINETSFCNMCGEKLPPNSNFCSKCGGKITR